MLGLVRRITSHRARSARSQSPFRQAVADIQFVAAALERRPDKDLLSRARQLRECRLSLRESTGCSSTIEACALLREAVRRTLGLTYYDVQLLAGLVLGSGRVAEMQTGEGKTIVAAIPALLSVLRGSSVHVATPNSYLARRDCEILRPAFELLGITVGLLPEQPGPAKQQAYECDVVYGTGYEFGFDYLREQLVRRRQPALPLGRACLFSLRGQDVERPSRKAILQTVVVDEIDSVLIDEALTPLVLSEAVPSDPAAASAVREARRFADSLERSTDYQVDLTAARVELTATGRERVFTWLREHPQPSLHRPWSQYVEQSLVAKCLLRRDVDYVVRDDRVQIVDQKTGRIFTERSWRAGLHQAVEAREDVPIRGEQDSAARITRQRFYQLYDQLCGMTGTAAGAEPELAACYRLAVVPIPPHRPSQRRELPDRFFASADAKFAAITRATIERHRQQQPVLIGTRTIEDSRRLAELFASAGLQPNVLNGLQDRAEAEVIAEAGRAGAITIATNMAGRGTDIQPDSASLAAGGLHVIGVERHESRRIDRQLAGRAARQGDPGSCQFFLSADDLLLARHQPAWSQRLRRRGDAHGECHRESATDVERLQRHVERKHFAQRQQMMQNDRWLDSVLNTLVREG